MKSHRPIHRPSHSPAHSRQRSRRGSWLVQAIVTMAILSVLTTIASTSLFQMFRQESRMVERTFQTSTWLQLSQTFRRDLHSALMVKQSDDGSRLELVTTEGPVTWLADGEKVRRTTQSVELDAGADASAIANLPGEQYVFSDSVVQLSLTVGTTGHASLASIQVSPQPEPGGGSLPPKVVVATAGLDHRFLSPVAMPEEQP